ncbi:MAG: hypothetical protein Tsb002_20360 [Wenzhouxiangellaceae bacterium]
MVTPAVLGWLARDQLRQQLLLAGIAPERIIVSAGWLSSRMAFPLPDSRNLAADVQLRHGPYLGDQGWGWVAAAAGAHRDELTLARLNGTLKSLGSVHLQITAEPALRQQYPQLQWSDISVTASGRLGRNDWRGLAQLTDLRQPGWQIPDLRLDWQWRSAPQPLLSLWLNGGPLEVQSRTNNFQIGQLEFNLDWLEQGTSGSLRFAGAAHQLRSNSAALENWRLSAQLAPLDRSVIYALPQLLPTLLAHPETLGLQLSPLLALRPTLVIDQFILSGPAEAINISGTAQVRPGGVRINTRGGGPQSLYLEALDLLNFAAPASQPAAREKLEQIRRQGWLQRDGDDLRADIVINLSF